MSRQGRIVSDDAVCRRAKRPELGGLSYKRALNKAYRFEANMDLSDRRRDTHEGREDDQDREASRYPPVWGLLRLLTRREGRVSQEFYYYHLQDIHLSIAWCQENSTGRMTTRRGVELFTLHISNRTPCLSRRTKSALTQADLCLCHFVRVLPRPVLLSSCPSSNPHALACPHRPRHPPPSPS